MRARRRFSSSGFRLCRRACRPRLRRPPAPAALSPVASPPGSYLAQLAESLPSEAAPCSAGKRRRCGADLWRPERERANTERRPRPIGTSGARPKREPVVREPRPQPGFKETTGPPRPRPAESGHLWVPPPPLFLRGGGGRGDGPPGSAPGLGVPSAAGRGPGRRERGAGLGGAPSSQSTLRCVWAGEGWGQALALPCPALLPSFEIRRLSERPEPGQGDPGLQDLKSPASQGVTTPLRFLLRGGTRPPVVRG